MLLAAGLLAVGVGVLAYRQMDDGRPVPLLADVVTALRRDTTARRRLAGGGVFIAFEGGEGAGKSTQVKRLQEWLTNEGLVARTTFEPGATPSGAGIRAILLDRSHTAISAALGGAAVRRRPRPARARRRCGPALDAGEVVITDRFVDSSLAYQGAGRTIPLDDVRMLSRWATGGLQPDLTILLDLPPETGLARARGRVGGRPDGVGVPGLPPAGAADLPRAGRDRSRPLPGARRHAERRRARRRDPGAGRRPALRPAAADAAAAGRPAAAEPTTPVHHHPHAQTGATPQLHP